MKKIVLFMFVVMLCAVQLFAQKGWDFPFESEIKFLQSKYCDCDAAAIRFAKHEDYERASKAASSMYNVKSVYDTINQQTEYYKKHDAIIQFSKGVKSSKFAPVYFHKQDDGKLSVSVNFIRLGDLSNSYSDKRLIDLIFESSFDTFKLLSTVCLISGDAEISRIGMSFLYNSGVDEAYGIAMYTNRSDIDKYDNGELTKNQFISKCTFYRLRDKFRLISYE